MSYILDALRKSEEERQHGTVPDFMTVQDTIVQQPKKRLLLPYLLMVSLIINAALLAWWLVPWQSKKSGQVKSHATAGQQPEFKRVVLPSQDLTRTSSPEAKIDRNTPMRESEIITPKKEDNPKTTIRQQQSVRALTDVPEQVSTSIPVIDKENLHEIAQLVPQQSRRVHQLSVDSKGTKKSIALRDNKIYSVEDLPLSIQQSLPTFTISVSLYSDEPASRMAKINGSMIREGEYLTAGLKLEEITPDGLILSYQNYRFRIAQK